MKRKQNVTIGLDEQELNILIELNNELSRRSFKKPNRTETVKFAIEFTRYNLDVKDLFEELKHEFEMISEQNGLLKKAFIEYHNKINMIHNP
ncbi:hypothetical protein GKZ89_08880 [Bacillus mangrovi]|uniref:Uncharacterized protein n=1 Tax=Metabacillus mangrovi TaxID=1491830 RepID=A0A7X2S5E5_9BACI|nr:hypothetical protein [Metabacillus mangrovi]MTH53531.1 hypothetical protein [Metabacillus mangrovi]